MNEINELDEFLKEIPMLEECSKLERQAVKESLKYKCLKKNEILFKQNEPGYSIYIVKTGLIGAYTKDSSGKKRKVARFSPGKSFGEMAIIEHLPRTTSCYAIIDSELLVMEAQDFYQFIWNYPIIGLKILKSKLRNMVTWLSDADNFLTHMVMWGEKARYRVMTDDLTGLYNVRFFKESMEINISKSIHKNLKFSVLLCDLDDFHDINENFGVETGDKILRIVAGIFKANFNKDAIISRLGGDEFTVLLPGTLIQNAIPIANKFISVLETAKIRLSDNTILNRNITISIGAVECPAHGKTYAEIIEIADRTLYKAKKSGKNRVISA